LGNQEIIGKGKKERLVMSEKGENKKRQKKEMEER